jgi:hypothetical protein
LLADDLSEEVGAAGECQSPGESQRESTEAVDTAVNLDAELRALEKLVAATSDEIDSDPQGVRETSTPPEKLALAPGDAAPLPHESGVPPDAPSALPDAGSDASPASPDAPASADAAAASLPIEPEVPDVLAEFTPPEAPGDRGEDEFEPPPPAEAPSAPAEVPDFAADFTRPQPDEDSASEAPASPTSPPTGGAAAGDALRAGPTVSSNAAAEPDLVAGDGVDAPTGLPEPDVRNEPVQAPLATEPPSASNQQHADPKPSGTLRMAASRLSPRIAVLGNRIVTLLEAIDRPVTGINGSVRRAIGWLAIATIGVSLVVYMVSLL